MEGNEYDDVRQGQENKNENRIFEFDFFFNFSPIIGRISDFILCVYYTGEGSTNAFYFMQCYTHICLRCKLPISQIIVQGFKLKVRGKLSHLIVSFLLTIIALKIVRTNSFWHHFPYFIISMATPFVVLIINFHSNRTNINL